MGLDKGSKWGVLDHGHVVYMDHMGCDAAVVEAARTSYQTGTKAVSDDKTLVRYLMRHRHSSPFESCTLKFHIKLPIHVERQWCLAGRTELHFDRGVDNKGKDKNLYRRKTTVDELFRAWNTSNRWKVKKRFLRKLDADGRMSWTHVKDIWKTGSKAIYCVKAKVDEFDSFELWVTADHPFFTSDGWKSLEEFCDLPTDSNPEWNSSLKVCVIGRMDGRENKTRREPVFNTIDESTEEWVPLAGWEEFYEISSQGRVRGTPVKVKHAGRIKSPVIRDLDGYKRPVVILWRPGGYSRQKVVSRAMMESFKPNRDSGKNQVCHDDGNPFNNVLSNLKWGDINDNTLDSIAHGTHAAPKVGVAFTDILEITYCGVEETYDIEVTDDDHNFVAGGFVVHNCRHRTAGWNEVSARYSELPDECYVPDNDHVCFQATNNRQGSAEPIPHDQFIEFEFNQRKTQQAAHDQYRIDLANGVSREIARNSLPLSTYTEKVWYINLHNLLHFLGLRMDRHAQREIREFATIIGEKIVAELFPITWQAFLDYRLNAMMLTALDIAVIQKVMSNHFDEGCPSFAQWMTGMPEEWHMTRCRERDEFFAKITNLKLYAEVAES